MVDGKYVAYFSDTDEYSIQDTHAAAVAWLREMWEEYIGDECYPDDTCRGYDFIAKITHYSKFVVTDTRAMCEARGEEWYDSWEEIGEAVMVPIDTEEEKK